jgi:hypothetical protein
MDISRRQLIGGAAAIAATVVVPLPAIAAPVPVEADLDWWAACELRAILEGLAPLAEERYPSADGPQSVTH